MGAQKQPEPAALVIFGGEGDLTQRKLVPALMSLYRQQTLPEPFSLIGVDRAALSDDVWRQHLRAGVDRFGRGGPVAAAGWDGFARGATYLQGDFNDAAMYTRLNELLAQREQQVHVPANRLFYLATPPAFFGVIAGKLEAAGLARERARLIIEKPLGYDLQSATRLNRTLTASFAESQLFRIDHYLGKETVQNILALRFANPLFEPIWDRRYVEYVTVTVAEEVGVEHRGGYYEGAGALRDMVQNHLLQLVCLVAMEPPVSFDADEVRNKKVDVLHAMRPIGPEAVRLCSARGQYGGGWVKGEHVVAYREEPAVAPDSQTETFAALKLFVDNWRWQGVPFYLRSGKRMAAHVSEVSIHFRAVPHRSFPDEAALDWQPARLVMCIQPDEGVVLRFQAKQPGPRLHLRPVDMRFSYREAFKTPSPDAYETLLWDVMQNDATLFMRADQVEAAWALLTPVLDAWASSPPRDVPNVRAGGSGPESAEGLISRDGRGWPVPTVLDAGDLHPPSAAPATT